jgi:hypothetical protein
MPELNLIPRDETILATTRTSAAGALDSFTVTAPANTRRIFTRGVLLGVDYAKLEYVSICYNDGGVLYKMAHTEEPPFSIIMPYPLAFASPDAISFLTKAQAGMTTTADIVAYYVDLPWL